MSAIDDLLKKHRKRVIAREEAAFRELLAVYQDLQRDLRVQYQAIQKLMTEAAAAGEEISSTWVLKSRRLKDLLAQVQEQVVRFGGRVSPIVSREQQAAIQLAAEHTGDVVRLTIPNNPIGLGSMLPTRAIENGVGMLGNGSPMVAYFEKTLAPAVAEAVRSEILKAVATGTDFRTIAKRLMAAGDITRSRALAMARTEVNRVRRATTLQIYNDNSDVIEGWEWVAAKSERTCPVCLALDGSIHKLSEPFPQHINCRCTMIPVIIGVPRPDRLTGQEWFDAQPDEIKARILGPEAAAAYTRGEITLKDLIGWRNSREFGKSVYTKPLSLALLGKAFNEIGPTRNASVNFVDEDAKQVLLQLLGRKQISDQSVATLIGAIDGAAVRVETDGMAVRFAVKHPWIRTQVRYLARDPDGDLFIYNSEFFKTNTAPPGLGKVSFARQAFQASELGVKYIRTMAAGDHSTATRDHDRMNGYYTWPRFGYNAAFNDFARQLFESKLTQKRKIYDVLDLMKTEDGRDVWYHYGEGGYMIFVLDGRSKSMRALKRYIIESNAK